MWQETIHKKDRGGRTSAVPPGDNCFGGYCDWRVPTVQELVQLSSHLAEAREFWVNQCCIGDSLKARLCRLCQSDSWLCVRSVDNPVDSSLAPFDGINDDILALDVRNWVEDCDPPRSDCYEEYWEFHEVSLVNGEVSTVTLSVYVNPPYVAGYCTHNWRWLLVRDVG